MLYIVIKRFEIMTNLEKIKEILNKYTEPQDMEYYLQGCIMNEQFNDLAMELVKKLTLTDVSQQRELLLDYEEWLNEYPNLEDRKKQVDKYLNK